jgi:NADH-quinone oxidoreductase subunit N
MTSSNLERLQIRLGIDLFAFSPELILCGAIVLLLLLRLFSNSPRVPIAWVTLVMTCVALMAAGFQWHETRQVDQLRSVDLFGGMLVFDSFSIFIKIFLLVFTIFVIVLCMLTGIPDHEDAADFYVLLLGAVVGMALMAGANHLLMVFISIEMASLPSYALAGFLKGRRQSSEAALKYVVYGGGAAGIMLYGISLLAGKFGTGYLPDVLHFLSQGNLGSEPVLIMGLLFLLIGIAFKLAAVPFHFWCPDVFEGAAAEVGAFLSVASKGAALALLARIVIKLQPAADYLVPTLAFFAALTTTFGNLAAYGQTNLKRLLAYSTIAHAGFMMMGLVTLDQTGAGAVLFYLAAYLLMNLGAFAVVAFLRNQTGHEDITRFRGLVQRSPIIVVTLAVFLFSLLGLPPLAGFAAKFQIFAVLMKAGSDALELDPRRANILFGLVVIGGLNTALSLFYYVKVLKVMVLEKPIEEVEGQPVKPIASKPLQSAYLVVLAALILALGVFWDQLSSASADRGVQSLTAVQEKEVRK